MFQVAQLTSHPIGRCEILGTPYEPGILPLAVEEGQGLRAGVTSMNHDHLWYSNDMVYVIRLCIGYHTIEIYRI